MSKIIYFIWLNTQQTQHICIKHSILNVIQLFCVCWVSTLTNRCLLKKCNGSSDDLGKHSVMERLCCWWCVEGENDRSRLYENNNSYQKQGINWQRVSFVHNVFCQVSSIVKQTDNNLGTVVCDCGNPTTTCFYTMIVNCQYLRACMLKKNNLNLDTKNT